MLNLLIIDDEKYIRKILNEILSKEGYVIDEAVDGDEGWIVSRADSIRVANILDAIARHP